MISKFQEFAAQVDKKRMYTAGATLVAALATGYMMQRGESPAAPQIAAAQMQSPVNVTLGSSSDTVSQAQAPQQPTQDQPVLANGSDEEPETPVAPGQNATNPGAVIAALEIPAPAAKPAPEEVTRAATDSTAPLSPAKPDLGAAAPAGLADQPALADDSGTDCTISMSGAPIAGALVMMNVAAPCHADQDVLFNHAGLRFTENLDESGTISLIVPAMMSDVSITAEFQDGTRAESRFTVPEASQFDRVALVWEGGTGLQLHALENGAAYGEEGHVWAENPRLPVASNARDGGFLSVLGSSKQGYAADVYSYPSSTLTEPDISIEAQILETTCGASIEGEYLRSQRAAPPVQTPVAMAVPDCEAVGDFLVLKNLPQELKIARN